MNLAAASCKGNLQPVVISKNKLQSYMQQEIRLFLGSLET